MTDEHPFEVGVNYLDSDGHNQFFCRRTKTDSLQKLKNRLDLPDEVNYIEISLDRIEVTPKKKTKGDC